MKLFLDANVIFTAAYSAEGLSRGLFRLAEAEKCTLCTSAFAHEEALRNIQKKAPDKMQNLKNLMIQLSMLPEANPEWVAWVERLPLTEKDAPVLAAAIQGKADIFVTGDKRDFGHLFGKIVEGVTILTPANAVKVVCRLKPE